MSQNEGEIETFSNEGKLRVTNILTLKGWLTEVLLAERK